MFEYWQKRSVGRNLVGLAAVFALWVVVGNLLVIATTEAGLPAHYAKEVTWVALAASTLLVVRWFERMPLAFVGLDTRRWVRETGRGLALGLGVALVAYTPVLVAAIAEGQAPAVEGGVTGLWLWLSVLLIDAIGEEFLFRGYFFGRIVEIVGPIGATLLCSVGFAISHVGNPGMTWIALTNLFLGGVFFALCYLRTRSLWVVIGLHAAWNIAFAKVLGLPVSGVEFGESILRTPLADPVWLTGGAFGPEGGVAATAALLVGVAVVSLSRRFEHSPYAYATLFRAFSIEQRANLPSVEGSER